MYQNLWWPSKTAKIFEKHSTRDDSDREEEKIKTNDGKQKIAK